MTGNTECTSTSWRHHVLFPIPETSCLTSHQFIETLCATNFANFLYGRASLEESGISPAVEPDSSETPFATAVQIIRSRGKGPPETSGKQMREALFYTTRMLNFLYIMAGLVIGGFAIAVCFSRLAHAHTCFLESAWQSAATGSYMTSGGEGDEEKGAMLGRPSALVANRVATLANSRKLSVCYFLFLVLLLAMFAVIGIMVMRGNNETGRKVDGIVDLKVGVMEKIQELMEMRAKQAAAGAAQGGRSSGGQDQPASRPSGGRPQKPTGPPTPVDKIVMDLLTPKVTHDSGIFLCNISVLEDTSPEYSQCTYQVSKSPDKSHYDYLNMLLEVKQTMDAGFWLTCLLFLLLLVHIVNFFLFTPRSLQRSLVPLARHLGVKVTSYGLGFAFTDLAFVASFVPMGSRAAYMVGSSPGGTDMRQVQSKL